MKLKNPLPPPTLIDDIYNYIIVQKDMQRQKMADTYRSEGHFNHLSLPPSSPGQESLFADHNVGTGPRDGAVDSQVTTVCKKSES